MALLPLPVDAVLPELTEALQANRRVVLEAPTGAGKTTRVPPALIGSTEESKLPGSEVWVLEPRRVAARAAAVRVAEEQGWQLGEEVGYQIRFDKRSGLDTRILFVTEGVLLRKLQDDPFLETVGCVVLDEFHERSLQSDTALALLLTLQQSARDDLRLVVMSATLDTEVLAQALAATVVRSAGRTYPVSISYGAREDTRPLPEQVAAAVLRATRHQNDSDHPHPSQAARAAGSILAFLPGVGEIKRTRTLLEKAGCGWPIHDLYGDLPLNQQHAVLRSKTARVVLATNVAETSVTVEGVTVVIDSGVQRQMRLEARTGIDRLVTLPNSRASADQRAGRAGRQAPGLAKRLWTESQHSARVAADPPEIHRVDFTSTYLYLRAQGEDPARLPWLDPPTPSSLDQSARLLQHLGALDQHGVTAIGRVLSTLPLHPRLGHLLLAAAEAGLADDGSQLAALLSERDILTPQARDRVAHLGGTDSDLLDRLDAVQGQGPLAHAIDRRRQQQTQLVAQQLIRSLPKDLPQIAGRKAQRADRRTVLAQCLLRAFPDRLALFNNPATSNMNDRSDQPRGRLAGGGGVTLSPVTRVHLDPSDTNLVLCLEFGSELRRQDRKTTAVHSATLIDSAWLDPTKISQTSTASFDPASERVVGRMRTEYTLAEGEPGLVLASAEADVAPEVACAALCAAAMEHPEHALGLDRPQLAELLHRIHFANRALGQTTPHSLKDHGGRNAGDGEGESEGEGDAVSAADSDQAHTASQATPADTAQPDPGVLPIVDTAFLRNAIPMLSHGCRSYQDLRRAANNWLLNLLTYPQSQTLSRLAPSRITLPNGRSARIDYSDPRSPPILAARIQDLFGWQDTPTVAAGRVTLRLHLLAPNQRPQQITDDLRGFWTGSYELVRRDLAGRYPKHPWPKDPLNASPTFPKKRR